MNGAEQSGRGGGGGEERGGEGFWTCPPPPEPAAAGNAEQHQTVQDVVAVGRLEDLRGDGVGMKEASERGTPKAQSSPPALTSFW